MPRKPVEIIDGMRSSADRPSKADVVVQGLVMPEKPKEFKTNAKGDRIRRFGSRFGNYILSVSEAQEMVDRNGVNVMVRKVHQVTIPSYYETADPKIIAAIESASDYGLGRNVWCEDLREAQVRDKAEQQFFSMAKADPELRTRLLRELTGNFEVPKADEPELIAQ